MQEKRKSRDLSDNYVCAPLLMAACKLFFVVLFFFLSVHCFVCLFFTEQVYFDWFEFGEKTSFFLKEVQL